MPRDVQHECGETAGIEHLITERVATETRAGLIEPLGLHRPGDDRRGKHRQHIVAGLAELAIQRLPTGELLLAAPMVAQRMRADRDPRTILQHHRVADTFTIDKCTIGRAQIGQHDTVVLAFQSAVPT